MQDDLLSILSRKAEAGDAEAQYELGWRHALGNGAPEDETIAVKWLLTAARSGHQLACNNLGARYFSGEGVPHDLVEAYRWFHLAAEKGDRKAGKNRDTVAQQLTPEEIQEALRRAADIL
jgi:TPR repeat protein